MTDSPSLTYLITGTQFGGATVGMNRLLSGINSEDFDITVVAVAKTEEGIVPQIPDYVTFKRLGLSNKYSFHRLTPLIKILRNSDILVCSTFHASAIGVPLGRVLGLPKILVWQHNTQPANFIRYVDYHVIYRLADRILADSERVKTFVHSEYHIPKSKISMLPISGIDIDTYRPLNSESNDKCISIGSVGRLIPEKGFDDLIKCALSLGGDYHFYIAGEGSQRDWIETHAPENVTLCGAIPNKDIPEFLNRNDIYFQPSKREGLCMTVIEAMACGLPVVASNVGGIPESVIPGTTGYLCEAGDIDCFVNHLQSLGSNPKLRQNMGYAGRERVINNYSRSALVEKFEQIIWELDLK